MLKYKSTDAIKLIDTFAELSEKGIEGLQDAMVTLTNYPPKVIQAFLDGVNKLPEKFDKEKYWGMIGVITMKMNFADMDLNED